MGEDSASSRHDSASHIQTQMFLAITHDVHRSAALPDAICVDDVHHPAEHPGV